MTTRSTSPPRRRPVAGVVVGVLVALVSGCSPTAGPVVPGPSASAVAVTATPSPGTVPATGATVTPTTSPSPTAAPPDGPLVATATASTLFDTQRAFRLELAGTGAEVVVRSLELASPWYVPVEPVARPLRLGEGSERLVPLPYGKPVCDNGSPGPGEAIGEVVAATDDGVVRIDLGVHPPDLVAGRHRRECAVAATRAAVDLHFAETWAVEGPRTATGSLVVAPRGDATVRVDDVEGNIVFTAEAVEVDGLPATVDGPARELPIRVTAARCDTHALIEAKNKTQYPVAVAVDDGEPVRVVVEATGATAATLQGLLENCLAATGDGSRERG